MASRCPSSQTTPQVIPTGSVMRIIHNSSEEMCHIPDGDLIPPPAKSISTDGISKNNALHPTMGQTVTAEITKETRNSFDMEEDNSGKIKNLVQKEKRERKKRQRVPSLDEILGIQKSQGGILSNVNRGLKKRSGIRKQQGGSLSNGEEEEVGEQEISTTWISLLLYIYSYIASFNTTPRKRVGTGWMTTKIQKQKISLAWISTLLYIYSYNASLEEIDKKQSTGNTTTHKRKRRCLGKGTDWRKTQSIRMKSKHT
ncbi:uncharacterized protein LOC110453949 [Mizuhopecten yessoensis]|uniref:uncharacterized protein LOC110453949 n=1 Tax=Mizuhopecten yessoensis TaxID=6573 RepID=UPI000B45AAAE|nr:uncharacterized protein LOC110453949 [Mizuhopecten yessoensis]